MKYRELGKRKQSDEQNTKLFQSLQTTFSVQINTTILFLIKFLGTHFLGARTHTLTYKLHFYAVECCNCAGETCVFRWQALDTFEKIII